MPQTQDPTQVDLSGGTSNPNANYFGGQSNGPAINSSVLSPTTQTTYNQPTITPPTNAATLPPPVDQATVDASTAEGPTETALSSLLKQTMAGNDALTGKAADQSAAETAQGLPDLQKTNTDLGTQLKALQNQALAIPLQQQQNSQGLGRTTGGLEPLQTAALRNNAIQALNVSTLLSANQGQIATAQMFADKAVADKYGPLEAEQNARIANLKLLSQDPNISIEQKKRADAQLVVQNAKADAIKNQREDYSTQIAWAVTAQQNGATPAQAQAIINAPDLKTAAATYAQFSKDPNATAKAVADLEQTRAQTSYYKAQAAKMYADAKTTGSDALDPSQAIAYAQEYASTGKIPTGLPKGTFGIVAQLAKEAPKADGTLINNSTGVAPSNISAGDTTNVSVLHDLTNKLNQLTDSYASLTPKPGQTTSRQDLASFNSLKSEIVDLLARARSGAALTADEMKTYNSKLPPGPSSVFYPSSVENININTLKNSIAGKLTTLLNTNNASLVGFSKVNVGGQQYTVGQTVTNAKGEQGRVNADGSITKL